MPRLTNWLGKVMFLIATRKGAFTEEQAFEVVGEIHDPRAIQRVEVRANNIILRTITMVALSLMQNERYGEIKNGRKVDTDGADPGRARQTEGYIG